MHSFNVSPIIVLILYVLHFAFIVGNLLKNSNGSGGKRAEESATSTLESLIINEDDNG